MTVVSCMLGAVLLAGCSGALPPPHATERPRARRHWLGIAAGGSGYFQVVYRYRLLEPLAVEVGTAGASHLINGSFGLLSEVPVAARGALHVGSGVGLGNSWGDVVDPKCPAADTKPDNCQLVHGETTSVFAYFRAGPSLYVGSERRDVIGLDGGAWVGRIYSTTDDVQTSRRLLWPMAGIFYVHGY